MKKSDVISHFDDNQAEVARALDISKQAIQDWDEIIPEGMAYKLQVITGGRLQVDPSVYRRLKARRAAA